MKKYGFYGKRYAMVLLIAAFFVFLYPVSARAADTHVLFIAPATGNALINGSSDYYGVTGFDHTFYADRTYAASTNASPTVITYDTSDIKQEIMGTVSPIQMYYFQVTVIPANFDAAYSSFGTLYDNLTGIMINDVSAFDNSNTFVQSTNVFMGDQYRYFIDFSSITSTKPTVLQFIAPATLNLHFIKDRSTTPLHTSFKIDNFSSPGTNDFSESSGIVFSVRNFGPVSSFLPISYEYTELDSVVNFFLFNYQEADYANNSVKLEMENLLRQAVNAKNHRNVTNESAMNTLIASLDDKASNLTPVSSAAVNYAALQASIDGYVAANYANNTKKIDYESFRQLAMNFISTASANNQLAADIYRRRLDFALSQLSTVSPSGVDLTQLKTELAKSEYANYQSENYMNNQYSNRTQFEATLNRAKAITDATSPVATTAQEVAQLLADLPTQFAALIDQTALRTALEVTYKDFNKDLYLDNDARTAFVAALSAAQNMYTGATAMNQTEVDALTSPLATLYAALTTDPTAIALKDAVTGVQVTGKIDPQAALSVTANGLHAADSCAACDEIRGLLNSGKLLALYDIALSHSFEGAITVSIPVDAQHNGTQVSILHCKKSSLEIKRATVANGTVSGSFSSLSPFAVVSGEYTSTISDDDNPNIVLPPNVGDEPYIGGAHLLFCAGALLCVVWHRTRFRGISYR